MRLRTATAAVGAGARDHWVTIQTRPDESTADSGFPTDAPWTDFAVVAMAREDVDVDEIERSAQLQALNTTRWEMPYMAKMDPERVDVTKLRRLMYLGRCFDILGAMPIGREAAIALLTEAYGKTPTEAP